MFEFDEEMDVDGDIDVDLTDWDVDSDSEDATSEWSDYQSENDEEHNRKDLDKDEARGYVNDKLSDFFFGCSISFRTVDHPLFAKFIQAVSDCPYPYRLPCRKTVAAQLLDRKHKKIVNKKRKILKDTDSVLLVDGWKNTATNQKLLVFSVRNENTTQTFLRAIDISKEEETGDYLGQKITEATK